MREIPVGTKLWKKCYRYGKYDSRGDRAIVELEVTEPGICAYWHSADSFDLNSDNKCRVRAARVVKITADDGENITEAYSYRDLGFVYIVGEEVRPVCPFDDTNVACASGIHGFETIDAAEAYRF